MMLAGPSLRVVPITIHVPFADVPAALTAALIKSRAHATARGLRRLFGIEQPRLAMAGLNPHAGEERPAGPRGDRRDRARHSSRCARKGSTSAARFAADAMFSPAPAPRYDAALCCYHDQALIPIKTLHFDDGVNITLGLPIVRTSPDHGTAFDIAGQGHAHPGAMIAAIKMARDAELCRRSRHRRRPDMPPVLPPLREVIAAHGLRACKALGQNFLLDEQLLDRIAAIPGALAGRARVRGRPRPGRPDPRPAARRRACDRGRARPALPARARRARQRPFPAKLRVIEGDALEVDPRGLNAAARPISSPTCPIMSGRRCWSAGSRARLAALVEERDADVPGGSRRAHRRRPDTDHYGRLAVLAQWRCDARIAMKVHRSAFTPPPKVMSAVVHVVPGRAAGRRGREDAGAG